MCFIDNLLLLPTLNNFQNQLTVDEVIAKGSTPRFFLDTVLQCIGTLTKNHMWSTELCHLPMTTSNL